MTWARADLTSWCDTLILTSSPVCPDLIWLDCLSLPLCGAQLLSIPLCANLDFRIVGVVLKGDDGRLFAGIGWLDLIQLALCWFSGLLIFADGSCALSDVGAKCNL